MSNEFVISVKGVSKLYGGKTVLNNISLDIPRSEIFGLLGPSGAGKTTLVKMIAGIEQAQAGEIELLGTRMPKLEMMQQIGYMAQSDALYADLNAQENLEFFASLYGLIGTARRRRIAEVLSLVNLTDDRHKTIGQFSGGMKRRLSLAVSLLHSPQVLILDEPTVGIDPVLRQSIWRELDALSRQGTTILVTTHVMDEAYKCHRLGMIRDGQLIAAGTPAGLMEETGSESIEEAFLKYGGVSQ